MSLIVRCAPWNLPVNCRKLSMESFCIDSKDSIGKFFKALIEQYNIVLFPDLDFSEYGDDQPVFSPGECKSLDTLMIECFNYCDQDDLDIYELAAEAQVLVYKEKGLLPQDFPH
jgi:hypothetical protein